jgi:hypothetical protein
MSKLLSTLNRVARNIASAFALRTRLPLSALLDHEEHGGPAPR